jgi:hypothetical protein
LAICVGDGERLLYGVLGDIDVAEDADQGGHRPPGLLAEDPGDLGLAESGRVGEAVHPVSRRDQRAVAANGRTSIGLPTVAVTFDAHPSAASRSSASMM